MNQFNNLVKNFINKKKLILYLFGCLIFLNFLIPPFQSPDDFNHFKRAYLLTEGEFVLKKYNLNTGGEIDNGLLDYMNLHSKIPFNKNEKYTTEMFNKGKGIKFVREDVKFFSKTNINCRNGLFKTILLYNADKLTIDAQSALRRCIEQFSHSTRFIITAHDKKKILKPILSRFCSIFVQNPINNMTNEFVNLHHIKLEKYNNIINKSKSQTHKTLKSLMNTLMKNHTNQPNQPNSNKSNIASLKSDSILQVCEKIYNKGYSGLDMIVYIEENKDIDESSKYRILSYLHNHKKEFRCEKTFILMTIYCALFRSIEPFHNLLFM